MTMIRTAEGLLALAVGTRVANSIGEIFERQVREVTYEDLEGENECMVWFDEGLHWNEYVDLQPHTQDRMGQADLNRFITQEGPFEIQEAS